MAEEEAEDQKVRQSARDALDRLSSDDKVDYVIYILLYVCMCVRTCVCACVHTRVYVCICHMRMCVCIRVHACIHMGVFVYHIRTSYCQERNMYCESSNLVFKRNVFMNGH